MKNVGMDYVGQIDKGILIVKINFMDSEMFMLIILFIIVEIWMDLLLIIERLIFIVSCEMIDSGIEMIYVFVIDQGF